VIRYVIMISLRELVMSRGLGNIYGNGTYMCTITITNVSAGCGLRVRVRGRVRVRMRVRIGSRIRVRISGSDVMLIRVRVGGRKVAVERMDERGSGTLVVVYCRLSISMSSISA